MSRKQKKPGRDLLAAKRPNCQYIVDFSATPYQRYDIFWCQKSKRKLNFDIQKLNSNFETHQVQGENS